MIKAITSCTGTGTGPRTNCDRDEAIQSLISLENNNLFGKKKTLQFFLWYPTPFEFHLFYSNFPSEGSLIRSPSSLYGFPDSKKFHIDGGPLMYHGSQPSQNPDLFPCILWRRFMSKGRERRQRTLRVSSSIVLFGVILLWFICMNKNLMCWLYYKYVFVYHFIVSDASMLRMHIFYLVFNQESFKRLPSVLDNLYIMSYTEYFTGSQ